MPLDIDESSRKWEISLVMGTLLSGVASDRGGRDVDERDM
jgi:hypothetical protein